MTRYNALFASLCILLLAHDAHAEQVPEQDTGPTMELPAEPAQEKMVVVDNPVSIGGYGEMHYSATRPEDGPMSNEIDLHRLVLYVGRRFTDNIRFYSEVEVEHAIAADGAVGEVAVEQAFIDYDLLDRSSAVGELTLRTGVVLVPMGIINQQHEPNSFHGVERPSVDKVIIPSTWHEGGIGVSGKPNDQIAYQLYVLGGLNPLGFSAGSGIRGGRQDVGEARTDGLAFAGRAEFSPDTAATIGVSGYYNSAGKNADEVDADVSVLGLSADARGKFSGVEARAVFAMFRIGDSEKLNAVLDADGNPITDVAKRVLGAYGELAYNVLYSADTAKELLPFVRVEYYNTDPNEDTRTTVDIVSGLTFRPIPELAFKGDVIFRRKGGDVAGDNATLLNLGIGFLY